MRILVCGLLFTLLALTAVADNSVTGKWAGSFTMQGPDGSRDGGAVLMLKQEGAAITGTVGPGEDEQYPIQKGKIEGNKIALDVDHNGRTMKFTLVLAGDRITGDAQLGGEGPALSAKIDVKRSK